VERNSNKVVLPNVSKFAVFAILFQPTFKKKLKRRTFVKIKSQESMAFNIHNFVFHYGIIAEFNVKVGIIYFVAV